MKPWCGQLLRIWLPDSLGSNAPNLKSPRFSLSEVPHFGQVVAESIIRRSRLVVPA